MSSRLSKAAVAVAAATALAGAAFALGSQSDGSAVAAGTTKRAAPGPWSMRAHGDRNFHGGPAKGLAAIAKKLGVTQVALRNALRAVVPSPPTDGGELATALAQALGVPQSKVTAAFAAIRAQAQKGPHEALLPAALASQLGVSTAKVKRALRQAFQTQMRAHEDAEAAAFASAFGVTRAQAATALDTLRGSAGHPPFQRGDVVAAFAKAFGVTDAQARAALKKLRAQREQQATDARNASADKLAAKLGISAAKVRAALADLPPFFALHGPGPGFPAGPGNHSAGPPPFGGPGRGGPPPFGGPGRGGRPPFPGPARGGSMGGSPHFS
jgi:hypothetical protein